MSSVLEDLKENPLWVYRVFTYGSQPSGDSSDKLLEKWEFPTQIREVIGDKKIKKFFPVQEKSIPLLLNNVYRDRLSVLSCDFIITAPTGQGKTLCYALPLIHNILKLNENRLLSLVIVPSRELVKQIFDVFSWFFDPNPSYSNKYYNYLKTRVFYGDRSFVKCQDNIVNDPPHIAITTPGVLFEYSVESVDKFYKTFKYLRWLVMDEVDVLLSQNFYELAGLIVDLVNKLRENPENYNSGFPQKILLSATVPLKSHDIDLLELNRPILIRLGEIIYKLPKKLKQKYLICTEDSKPKTLLKLLLLLYHEGESNILVFFSKIEKCHKIARFLQLYFSKEKGFEVYEFTGKLPQRERNRIINIYKKETKICLCCSDVASRGIDLSNTKVVVSFDFPKKIANYIHRAGRTARANNEGKFYALIEENEEDLLHKFMKKLKMGENEVEKVDLDNQLAIDSINEVNEFCEKLVKMTDKCLEMEKEKKLSYYSNVKMEFDNILNEY